MRAVWKAAGLGAATALIFMGHVSAQPSPSDIPDTNPDWLKKPSFDDMLYAWPRPALAKGESGIAIIRCIVNKQGLLQDCSVQSEEPLGEGFGAAALALTPTMLFKPATRHGQLTEASVSIPVTFKSPGKLSIRESFLVPTPFWSKAPNAKEVMAQLEKKVGDKFADGKVVFMCSLSRGSGKIKRCHVVNASEGMAAFKSVGDALTDSFQASPAVLEHIRTWPESADALVILPFSFPDMTSASWGKRYLSHVQWADIPEASLGHPLFPEEAVKAGIKEGVAAVDCVVADNGSLHDCNVTRESTPGVGLGAMAKTIAEGSAINPWTEEGLPAGGARVVMPIQMTYDPRFAATAAAPTPAAKP
jgi:TonB family protein